MQISDRELFSLRRPEKKNPVETDKLLKDYPLADVLNMIFHLDIYFGILMSKNTWVKIINKIMFIFLPPFFRRFEDSWKFFPVSRKI